MTSSRKEIKDSILNTSRQPDSQIGSLVEEFINLTLSEINNPGWAFPRKNKHHLWNFLRRKKTVSVSSEDFVLPRDVDKVALIRQLSSPIMLRQLTDKQFYRLVPNPSATGNPRWYRMWETEGVSTQLSTADTVDIVSSSTSDAGSAELSVSVMGFDSNGIWRTETYQLNGTSSVSGSITFAAGEIFVMKQKDTTGTITASENSGSTTLVVMGPNERAPKFKVISFYPIPSSAMDIYLEYFTYLPQLNNDSDVPLFDDKWHYVVRLGSLAKVYQYLNKETDFITMQAMYSSAVRAMVAADRIQPDLISHLHPRQEMFPHIHNRRNEDAIA